MQLQARQADLKKLRAAKASAEAKAASAALAVAASRDERSGGGPRDEAEAGGDLEGPPDQRKRRSLQAAAKAAAVPSAPPAVPLPPPSPRRGPTHILFLPPHVDTRPGFFKCVWVGGTRSVPLEWEQRGDVWGDGKHLSPI